ncbi:molybdopterin-dependent oxidoreductase [Paenarthrobacter sp. NPDC058040]|uniref:molybdopterin-dependent oxidoreductase n=1 Tax=unclassified Paenarthrobacter TaxID=2634190 RepID=UPI0036DC2FFA
MPRHLTHWGGFEAQTDGRSLADVRPLSADPDPNQLIHNVASAQHHPSRVLRPAVRKGWLLNGPGTPGRGEEPFVEVGWDEAVELTATALDTVYKTAGSSAVYGASYGWASAGRFHHAQSQIHRFLNVLGGYVAGRGDYSHGCSDTLLPHLVGKPSDLMVHATAWDVVAQHTELFIAFGGLSAKNSFVGPGGITRHTARQAVATAVSRGCEFISVSPLQDDTFPEASAEWLAPRPGTDAAIMLALAFVLDEEGLVDDGFLERYTTGYERFRDYLQGIPDNHPKTPEWASSISGIEPDVIRSLGRKMAHKRSLINLSWSLQRQQHGEQPVWLGITLAAMLGQVGRPGGGFAHAYGSTADIGLPLRVASPPSFPQGKNPEASFIPVARIADMLLHPGEQYDFDGKRLTYPDIKLVYWCGGNPFHHAQDLSRLRRAFTVPETVIVHEQFWTATARHADIVLPATMSIERDDYGAGRNDPHFLPMPALTTPAGQARDDYEIFADIASHLGCRETFTEGRTSRDWLGYLYESWRCRLAADGHHVVDFNTFWGGEGIKIPIVDPQQVLLQEFRSDPKANPLPTPSGKIEIFSEVIDSFNYPDCPGHPAWLEPAEWLGTPRTPYPLHLIANQPKTRLHSQLDVGTYSQGNKVQGREPVRMNAADAAARGLADGTVVRIFNDRGSCLAGLAISEAVREGVIQLATGAWFDPDPADPSFCRHGNPNVLIADRPTSRLTQATTGQHALVDVEKYTGQVPDLTINGPPEFVSR